METDEYKMLEKVTDNTSEMKLSNLIIKCIITLKNHVQKLKSENEQLMEIIQTMKNEENDDTMLDIIYDAEIETMVPNNMENGVTIIMNPADTLGDDIISLRRKYNRKQNQTEDNHPDQAEKNKQR